MNKALNVIWLFIRIQSINYQYLHSVNLVSIIELLTHHLLLKQVQLISRAGTKATAVEGSLLHEHEAWSSSGSSPIQYLKRQTRSSPVLQHRTLENRAHHKIKTGSPGSEVVTLQQFLEESNKLTSMQVGFIYGDLNLDGHYKLNFYG